MVLTIVICVVYDFQPKAKLSKKRSDRASDYRCHSVLLVLLKCSSQKALLGKHISSAYIGLSPGYMVLADVPPVQQGETTSMYVGRVTPTM